MLSVTVLEACVRIHLRVQSVLVNVNSGYTYRTNSITIIESLQFVARLLCIVHPCQQWFNAGIILPPKIVCKAH